MDGADEARRHRRVFVALVVTTLAVCVVGGIVVGVVLANMGDAEAGTGFVVLILGFPLLVVVLMTVALVFLVRWRRALGSEFLMPSPLAELPTARERTALWRSIRRGEPIPAARLDLAVRVVRHMSRQSGMTWLMVVVGLSQFVQVVMQDGWIRVLFAVSGVVFVALAGYWFWLGRRMWTRLADIEAVREEYAAEEAEAAMLEAGQDAIVRDASSAPSRPDD